MERTYNFITEECFVLTNHKSISVTHTCFKPVSIILSPKILSIFPVREIHQLGLSCVVSNAAWGEIYEPFMGLKSQVELTPPRPGQLGRYSGEDLIRLNSSEFKNSTSANKNVTGSSLRSVHIRLLLYFKYPISLTVCVF